VRDANLTHGPLILVKCETCGLVQLKHSYALEELYGMNYGYRSGLNNSMVVHLREKVARLLRTVSLKAGDIVLDIGSNDSTLLQAYPNEGQRFIGIDPSGDKFRSYYPPRVTLIPEFFSAAAFRGKMGDDKAKIVTSIAMFYDLEDPLSFVHEIESILADDGIWHFEQSYLPSMLKANAYDTVCHEHLEYYAFSQIRWMTARANLKILDVSLNDTNGGSFAVTVSKASAPYPANEAAITELIRTEEALELRGDAIYQGFRRRVSESRDDIRNLLDELKSEGKNVLGYGASTKGNVLLQYCNLTWQDIPYIAEVNPEKFGCFTPGTGIPIISEQEARDMNPDYFFVLPWHFRENIVEREADFLAQGGGLIFPLPELAVVARETRRSHSTRR